MKCPSCHRDNPDDRLQCRYCRTLLPRQSAKMLDKMTMSPRVSFSLGLALLFLAGLLFYYDVPWMAVLPLLCGLAFTAIGLQIY